MEIYQGLEVSQLRRIFEGIVPIAEVNRHLENAERLSRDECAFDLALRELQLAEESLRRYCEWTGYHYRKWERYAECYHHQYAKVIKMGTTRVGNTLIVEGYQAKRYYRLMDYLRTTRNSIPRNLKKFREIKQKKPHIEKRKQFFLRRRQEYEDTAIAVYRALGKEDLLAACQAILKLNSIREKATGGYINCPDKVAPDLAHLQNKVWGLVGVKVREVEELLDSAENAISSGMKDEARHDLQAAKEWLPRLVGPSDNECRLALEEPQLRDRVERLEKRLAGRVDLISGLYRSTWGDSALITNLGGGRYYFEVWQGSGAHPPDKSRWYNIGEGSMGKDGIYCVHTVVGGYAGVNIITESYWETMDERTIKQTRFRFYHKDHKPDLDVGWRKGPAFHLVEKK